MYSHKCGIVHRYLRPECILYDDEECDGFKITDWGYIKDFEYNNETRLFNSNPYYVAPEAILGKTDKKSDLWSVGVIIYLLLSGYPPFNGHDDEEIIAKINYGEYNFPIEE